MTWILAILILGRAPDVPPVEYHIPMAAERTCRDAVKVMSGGPVRARCVQAVDMSRHPAKLAR